jgi:DNA-binding NarL/FixJ family response regulator
MLKIPTLPLHSGPRFTVADEMVSRVLELRQEHRKNAEVVRRASAIVLAHQGRTSTDIKLASGLGRVAVWRLLRILETRGPEVALFKRKSPGRPSKRLAALALLQEGKSVREVARLLKLTTATVRLHRQSAQREQGNG